MDADKKKALDMAMHQIEKDFGKGSIMMLGEASAKMNIEVIPTGALSLDIALGVGGIPRGRVIEIYGPESSGKTTVALHMIAEAQKMGGYAAFIDAEHALDPEYARHLGVDIDDLLISQPDNGEQALEIADALVRSGAIDIIVIDSVAALVPRAEIEGEMGDSHVGLQARLMSQALRKLTGLISKSKCATIFINQIREKYASNTYQLSCRYNPEFSPEQTIGSEFEIVSQRVEGDRQDIILQQNTYCPANILLSRVLPQTDIISYQKIIPSMNDIFIKLVKEQA